MHLPLRRQKVTDASRLGLRDNYWADKKKPFIIGVVFVFLLLQLLFLGNLSYLYGVLFRSGHRVHNLNVLTLNLDIADSPVYSSLLAAYSTLRGDDFLALQEHLASDYPTIQAAREAVCEGHYWAAIVVTNGASSRLSDALAGGTAAETYVYNDALTLVYDSAKYTSATLGDIIGNLQTLVAVTNAAYGQVESTAIQRLNTTSAAAVTAFRNAIGSTTLDIMPTPHGARVLLNTVSMVFPIIQQFFFLMALNGISTQYKLYSRLRIIHSMGMRAFLSILYTFISSLAMIGYIWAFRENWGVTAEMFFLSWMTVWLYMFLNFAIIDAATGFIPMSFVPFFIVTWVVLNVGSTIYPLQLTAGFYHWQVALPGYNTYNTLVDIWSGGCNPIIYRTLPINFAWAMMGVVLANISMHRRCRIAARTLAEEEDALQARIDQQFGSASVQGQSEKDDSSDQLRRPSTRRTDTGRDIENDPYPEEVRREISRYGIRMPFADTVEGMLTRRNTAV